MQKKSMTKQAQRYIDHWGPGAIVFALVMEPSLSLSLPLPQCLAVNIVLVRMQGYCSDLQLPSSVLKLDASSFPTSRQLDVYSK
jgi:hypothetical protein